VEYEELKDRSQVSVPRFSSEDRRPGSEDLKKHACIRAAMNFYSTAVVRENKCSRTLNNGMGELKEQRAVIVTGGFHAEVLRKLAAARGCSYLQITPRINEVTNAIMLFISLDSWALAVSKPPRWPNSDCGFGWLLNVAGTLGYAEHWKRDRRCNETGDSFRKGSCPSRTFCGSRSCEDLENVRPYSAVDRAPFLVTLEHPAL